ncbi:MAG: cytochrome P450 [Gammaproteobacteria bacterium]|nr:cytochrome P450 [Gammaproteobacteria bacterium]
MKARLDLTSPSFLADPYPAYAVLRAEAEAVPVDPGGMWAVTAFDRVVEVLKRPEVFSSEPSEHDRERLFERAFGGANMIASDNPTHDRLRGILHKRFTPARMRSLAGRIDALCRELLDDVADEPEFDLVSAFTVPLPVIIISELLGVERHRIGDFKRWSNGLVAIINGASGEAREQALAEVFELAGYLAAAADRRRAAASDDLIGLLVAAEREPGRLSAGEVLSYCILLLAAGNETTTNLLGGLATALAANPDQIERLERDPALIERAVEEGLRYCSPVQGLFRRVHADTRLGDTTIPAGSRVWVSYGAANHDPTASPSPIASTSTATAGATSASAGGCTSAWAPISRAPRPGWR